MAMEINLTINVEERLSKPENIAKEFTGTIGEKETVDDKEVETKLKEFERLDLRDQIEKADRYLLQYL
jgi:hypothetical protein